MTLERLTVDSLQYRVVYDISHSFPDKLLMAALPLLVAFGGWRVYRDVSSGRWASTRVSLLGLAAMVVGGLACLLVVVGAALPDIGLRIAVAGHRYRIVEGTVTNFVPGDAGDHIDESWTVQTPSGPWHYAYSPHYLGVGGYDLTAAHGGQIRNGSRVRVTDVRGEIAKLELAP